MEFETYARSNSSTSWRLYGSVARRVTRVIWATPQTAGVCLLLVSHCINALFALVHWGACIHSPGYINTSKCSCGQHITGQTSRFTAHLKFDNRLWTNETDNEKTFDNQFFDYCLTSLVKMMVWCVLSRQAESTVHWRPVSALRISSTQRQFTAVQKICKVISNFVFVLF